MLDWNHAVFLFQHSMIRTFQGEFWPRPTVNTTHANLPLFPAIDIVCIATQINNRMTMCCVWWGSDGVFSMAIWHWRISDRASLKRWRSDTRCMTSLRRFCHSVFYVNMSYDIFEILPQQVRVPWQPTDDWHVTRVDNWHWTFMCDVDSKNFLEAPWILDVFARTVFVTTR